VGFGVACELAMQDLEARNASIATLREQLETGLKALDATIFGQGAERLPNTSFFAFKDLEGETLVTALDKAGYAVASGSACSSASTEPSHVLLAMDVEDDLARGAIRVSLSADNTAEQITGFLAALKETVKTLKSMSAIAA